MLFEIRIFSLNMHLSHLCKMFHTEIIQPKIA